MVTEGWRRVAIGQVVTEPKGGVSVRSQDRTAQGRELGVLKTSCVTRRKFDPSEHKVIDQDEISRAQESPRRDHIIFSRMNTSSLVGASALVTESYPNLFLPDRLWQFTSKNQSTLNIRWLSHVLDHLFACGHFAALSSGTSASMKNLPKDKLLEVQLDLPPLPEQRKIAAILFSVDEAIEKTQSVIDQVQVVKKGLMQELLTKGLPGRHQAFVQTAIGEIPSNWKVARIADVASVRSGSTPSRSRKDFFPASGGHPWVKTMDLTDGDIHATSETISDAALAESSCVLHRPGTVLIAMYGGFNQIGRTGVLRLTAATNQAISCISAPADVLAPEFLNYWLIANRWRWQRIAASSRKDPNITRDDVLRFELPLMSIEEQNAIIAVLNAVVDRETAEKRQLLGLLDTKSALSTLLLTGELRVRPDPEPTR